MSAAKTSQYYRISFATDKFSQRQLNFLAKIGIGFLSPKHDDCYQDKQKLAPHYAISIKLPQAVTNAEIKKAIKNAIRYPIMHAVKVRNLEAGTVSICHAHGKNWARDAYDQTELKWFGPKKLMPDYRLWFHYDIYTKSSLKKRRQWTNKCLEQLPDPTDTYYNNMYGQKEYPAWNEFVIADLEKQEPIKSILAKKNSPAYQKKRKLAKEKAKETKLNKIRQESKLYQAKFEAKLAKSKLSSEKLDLARILGKLNVLNHVAKTLADYTNIDNNFVMKNCASNMILAKSMPSKIKYNAF